MVNAEPQTDDILPITNINIVNRGGKKTREDCYTEDPPLILKEMSPQNGYQPKHQKQYYQEVAKLFEEMTVEKDTKRL